MENMNQGQMPDLLLGVSTADLQLDSPDMEQARQARRDRTRNIMKALDPTITNQVLPETDTRSVEDLAATRIQANYRGHLGRKKYIEELYNQFQQEEVMRLEKTLQQVEEGQLLVENHRLEVELDDNSTTRRNKSRHYLADIITIQRAWRRYKQLLYQGAVQARNPAVDRYGSNMSPSLSETDDSESSNGPQAMSVSSPDDSDSANLKDCGFENWNKRIENGEEYRVPLPEGTTQRPLIEAEPDSTVSDYSEMAEPIKEHLANVQIIQKEDLAEGNTMFSSQIVHDQKIVRQPDETDEEFAKRVRKINYLSLAQEFAALKKIDASALPFDLHKEAAYLAKNSPMSDSSATETDSSERYLSESADPSNATTPMEGNQEFLSGNAAKRPPCDNAITERNVEQIAEKLHGANLTSRGLWSEVPPGGNNRNLQDNADNNRAKTLFANGRTNQGTQANDLPFHDSTNAHDKKDLPLGDFDVYNIETTLPHMDWDLLEEQLQRAAEEERMQKETYRYT